MKDGRYTDAPVLYGKTRFVTRNHRTANHGLPRDLNKLNMTLIKKLTSGVPSKINLNLIPGGIAARPC